MYDSNRAFGTARFSGLPARMRSLPDEGYAGGGLVPDIKRRFGEMHVLRGDIFENAFIIYVTL